MARTVAGLPNGTRITDFISLGVIAKTFPTTKVNTILSKTGKTSIRNRNLPAHIVVYYVIALAFYMQSSYGEVLRCLLEGVRWFLGPEARVPVTGKSGISQARTRLGWEPMMELHDEVVKPVATKSTKGAWYCSWRIVSLDGSTLDVADERENDRVFGRPSSNRGESAFPRIRFVSLVENGTHVLFGSRMGGVGISEAALAREVLPSLKQGMLCLADRYFYGFHLWNLSSSTGADLLWRIRKDLRLPRERSLPDGSWLSTVYDSRKARRDGTVVRVIEYRLEGVEGAEPSYRLITTILDPNLAPAEELAALYHERWEIETALDELKTHLRGPKVVLRSKTPDLVMQEFYGLMMAHFAVRGLMHEAALRAEEDPDKISFIHAVRVIRRKLPAYAGVPPSEEKSVS